MASRIASPSSRRRRARCKSKFCGSASSAAASPCVDMRIRTRQHEFANQLLERPAFANEAIGEVIEQFRMRRPFAEHAEIIDRSNDAAAKQMVPDAIDDHTRAMNGLISRIGHLAGEFKPAAARLLASRLRAGQRFEQSPGHALAQALWRAADEDVARPRRCRRRSRAPGGTRSRCPLLMRRGRPSIARTPRLSSFDEQPCCSNRFAIRASLADAGGALLQCDRQIAKCR